MNTLRVPAQSGRGNGFGGRERPGHQLLVQVRDGAEPVDRAAGIVTFMGYVAPPDQLDVSNSNTPGVIDPTNPVPGADYRVVAAGEPRRQVPLHRNQRVQRQQRPRRDPQRHRRRERALHGGNAGNGGNPQPDGIIIGAGAQILNPRPARGASSPARPTPVGSFNITQLGRQARQDRQGHQLPRPDDLQQRPLLHQGQRRQRRQHRVLHRHHRQGLPERRRPAAAGRDAADLAASPTTRRCCRPRA